MIIKSQPNSEGIEFSEVPSVQENTSQKSLTILLQPLLSLLETLVILCLTHSSCSKKGPCGFSSSSSLGMLSETKRM